MEVAWVGGLAVSSRHGGAKKTTRNVRYLQPPESDVREVIRQPTFEEITSPNLERLRRVAKGRIGDLVARRYHLLEVLGVGAAGAVFAARHIGSGRDLAVKILHRSLLDSAEHVARFHREARAMTAIGHKGVADVFDISHDEQGTLYIAMERLEGVLLFDLLNERRLSAVEVVSIGRQLLDVLSAAHRHGILHRDVKPENILVSRDSSGSLAVKLLDFGIAKWIQQGDPAPHQTADGIIMGTPHYMSPEMCLADGIDEGADLWSTAIVLYHALTGAPPFDDRPIGRLLSRIVNEPVPSLAKFRPGLPVQLILTIDRALRRDKEQRWPSAAAFGRALEAVEEYIESEP
jgi:serine/threonine-protein kinase